MLFFGGNENKKIFFWNFLTFTQWQICPKKRKNLSNTGFFFAKTATYQEMWISIFIVLVELILCYTLHYNSYSVTLIKFYKCWGVSSLLIIHTCHSSLVDYLVQVRNGKNYPTHFYCIFNLRKENIFS